MGKQYLNGVLYGTGEIIKFSPEIYSLEEREVGVWTDGKPLYQKSFHIDTGVRNTLTQVVSFSALNIDDIVDSYGYFERAWSSGTGSGRFYFTYYEDSSDYAYLTRLSMNGSTPALFYYIKSQSSSDRILDIMITIKYTKTTDTPYSGKYTTDGTEAHHYSTSEKVIGTWIDGKPLYQKTINCGALPNDSIENPKYVNHNISNLDKIVCITGFAFSSTNYLPLPYTHTTIQNNQIGIGANGTYIAITVGANTDRSNFSAYITLQYTKTTD